MNVVVLPSARKRNAQANLKFFIGGGKKSNAFGPVDWNAPVWNDAKFFKHRRATAGRDGPKSLHFLTGVGGARGATDSQPFRQPLMDFAKAHLRVREDARSQSVDNHRCLLRAYRLLHDALKRVGHNPCLALPRHFEAAAKVAKERDKAASAYRTGMFLAEIAECLNAYGIARVRFDWKNPIPRPSCQERLGKDAERRRKEKLPSEAALDALPQIAQLVTTDQDVLRMRAIELLSSASWRINEFLTIPANCEVEEQAFENGRPLIGPDGTPIFRYGIRYFGEKGFGPGIKWIPTPMVDVAKRAIADIRRITDPVRRDAAWMLKNPGYVNVPGLDLGNPDDLIGMPELAAMLGFSFADKHWCRRNGLPLFKKKNPQHNYVRRGDVCNAIISKIPVSQDDFPIPLEKHMFLVRRNFFHPGRATIPGSVVLVLDQAIADFVTYKPGRRNIFARFGFAEPDGSPISMTSHQFRHWLNTLAQEGGLSQELIARWSGRTDVSQNAAYDHVPSRKLAEKLRAMAESGELTGPIIDAANRLPPVERKKFLDAELACGHVTEIGLCIHDWSLAPCPNHEDCADCGEHLVDKGNAVQRGEAEKQLATARGQLAHAEAEVDDGTYGASRWADSHRRQVASLKKILAIQDDVAIPNGTLVHLGQWKLPGS